MNKIIIDKTNTPGLGAFKELETVSKKSKKYELVGIKYCSFAEIEAIKFTYQVGDKLKYSVPFKSAGSAGFTVYHLEIYKIEKFHKEEKNIFYAILL